MNQDKLKKWAEAEIDKSWNSDEAYTDYQTGYRTSLRELLRLWESGNFDGEESE